MERMSLADVRAATYKPKDSWWTVFLVDPYAARLVRLVAGYRWVTPNRLTLLGTVLGLGSAACFLLADRWWLLAGVLLFHLSFVVDCMDGKLARLQGSGSVFGVWLDYIIDRFKVLTCGLALMGGLYRETDRMVYLWLAFGVVVLDLFHYLDLLRITQVKRQLRRELVQAREAHELREAAAAGTIPQPREDHEPRQAAKARPGRSAQIRNFLLHNRIRPNVVSGVEFQMAIFIVGPLIGPPAVVPVTLLAIGGLGAFELVSIYRLWRASQAFERQIAKLAPPAAGTPDQATAELDAAAAG